MKKFCKTVAIIAFVVSLIGLISFIGGVRKVNIGAFVFPLLISCVFLQLYRKQ